MIPLFDYIIENRLILLNPLTGEFNVKKCNSYEDVVNANCRGYGYIFRQKFYAKNIAAIYSFNDKMVLQIGCSTWQFDDSNLKVIIKNHLAGLIKSLKVYYYNKIVFKHSYLSRRFFHPLNFVDIIYDKLDAEADDFFIYLQGGTADHAEWRFTAAKKWANGIMIKGFSEQDLYDELMDMNRSEDDIRIKEIMGESYRRRLINQNELWRKEIEERLKLFENNKNKVQKE